ncbi:MAG: hypothetical protein HOU81_16555 [Hamadaea sp.]|uniref:hypothetical protein n=1 Tax=Hamadaea sp. TaxID=2024425 RepID=UPI0017B26876|nr:hypothetical protein [Hamadaea sp.]NUR72428.1 hypothetical protein [Hamadaea sp.]NUT19954.1 hypothetical protein [Hamadaea sp.]
MSKVRKSVIVAALRDRGLSERADWVDRAMPDEIDVHRNASLFDMLGIEPDLLGIESLDQTEPETRPTGDAG